MGLNAKKQRFVDEYVIDLHAANAAIRAGYSAKTAYSKGPGLLKDPEIKAAVDAKCAEIAKANALTTEWVIERLKLTAEAGIKGDSVKALELLGKTLGIFKERVEHSGPDGNAIPTSLEIKFVRARGDAN